MKRLAVVALVLLIALPMVGILVSRDADRQPLYRVKLNEHQDQMVLDCWAEGFDTRIESDGEGGTEIACVWMHR